MNAIKLALLQSQLEGVAEVMGTALARSAFSPNIRVRLDFSCAMFSKHGDLLAQAAHIPVHLGSMPDQIQRLVQTKELLPGDLYIANDPYNGGTHLPDITLMEPVFSAERQLLGVVAARAHHADVGGVVPASMGSQPNIYGDGLRIPILKLAKEGIWDPQITELLLHNMRSPRDREGDLLAQQSACHHGRLGMLRILEYWAEQDIERWERGTERLLNLSLSGTIRELKKLLGDERQTHYTDFLEIDSALVPISVSLGLTSQGKVRADFTGTSPGVKAGFNATLAVTKAAVCYVFRCLLSQELPLNQGFLDCFLVEAPEGSLVSAAYPQAVAAGNVETSQRIVDVIFGALSKVAPEEVPAASAGTMNNFSFGFENPQLGVHYETSGGGAGGCNGGPAKGCSGVQVHMTNTRSTPAEVLEDEFPLQVDCHRFRTKSGGAGLFSGGDGTIKELTFHQPAFITFMTSRRATAPYGINGGRDGSPGTQQIKDAGGEWKTVESTSTTYLQEGGSTRLVTPGGGGWGTPDSAE